MLSAQWLLDKIFIINYKWPFQSSLGSLNKVVGGEQLIQWLWNFSFSQTVLGTEGEIIEKR